MIKFLKTQFDIELIKNALIFALIYCVMFNISVVLHKAQYYQTSFFLVFFDLIKDFFYIYVATFVFFFGISIHRIVFIIGSIFFFVTGAIASYYLFYFGVAPTAQMMPAIYGTEISEISELVSIRIVIWILFSLFVCIFSIKHFNPQTTKSFFAKILMALCLFLLADNIISPSFRILKEYFPIQYLHNSYVYFFGSEENRRRDISKNFEFKSNNTADDVVGVLVIGESARYSNFGINGYGRDTTPNLSKIDNLFSFRGHSCANVTYLSVPGLLSRHNEENIDLSQNETGLLSVLTSLGYDTSWISTQSLIKYYSNKENTLYDEVNFELTPGGSLLYRMNAHDCEMLPFIEKRLENVGNKFLTIQLSGSHWNYASRYPAEFKKFTPVQNDYAKVDQASCTTEELINSYDNSILYTDFFLSNLIDLLKDKNAFLIFASDHAESLGEEGRFGHGGECAPEQRDIPFIFWFSEIFKQTHPKLTQALNSRKNLIISHDYIFHTILDCLDIESEIVDTNYSLCSRPTKNLVGE